MQHLPSHPSPRTVLPKALRISLPSMLALGSPHPPGWFPHWSPGTLTIPLPPNIQNGLSEKQTPYCVTYLSNLRTKTKLSSTAALLLFFQTCHSLYLDTSPFTHPTNSTGTSYCRSNVTSIGIPFLFRCLHICYHTYKLSTAPFLFNVLLPTCIHTFANVNISSSPFPEESKSHLAVWITTVSPGASYSAHTTAIW